VQGGEPARVPLVHRLRAVAQHVVQHVDLLVRGGEVHGPPRAVVLGPEVGIRLHDDGQLLGVAQAEAAVEGEGLELGLGRVAPGAWVVRK